MCPLKEVECAVESLMSCSFIPPALHSGSSSPSSSALMCPVASHLDSGTASHCSVAPSEALQDWTMTKPVSFCFLLWTYFSSLLLPLLLPIFSHFVPFGRRRRREDNGGDCTKELRRKRRRKCWCDGANSQPPAGWGSLQPAGRTPASTVHLPMAEPPEEVASFHGEGKNSIASL